MPDGGGFDPDLDDGDIPGGEQTKAERLRQEDASVHHLLYHVPKNPYCRTCQLAKAQRRSARRLKDHQLLERRRPKGFGAAGTCDHWFATDEVSRGIAGEEYGLTYKDLATGWVDCYPVKDKTYGVHSASFTKHAGPGREAQVLLHG